MRSLARETGGITDDADFLRATRTAAAREQLSYETPPNSAGAGRGCTLTRRRLAARANGSVSDSERAEFERHLSSCLVWRAAELHAARADRALAATLGLRASGGASVQR